MPEPRRNNTRFMSPRGGDPERAGSAHVTDYYNPRPAAVQKKQRIQQIAAKLFADRGVAGVGLNMVAQAANMPNGGVGYYYRNRDDLLADVLSEHVMALNAALCTAYDATETLDTPARLLALVQTFHQGVQASPHAHRALLFNARLLGKDAQQTALGRYRLLLGLTIGEVLALALPDVASVDVMGVLLPMLERLISGVVFWDADEAEPDAATRYAGLVTAMLLEAGRGMTADGPARERDAAAAKSAAGWLASATADPAPSWRTPAVAHDDIAAGGDSSARRERWSAELPKTEWLPAREAKNRWYQLLTLAGAGAEFVITVRNWPVAQVGPVRDATRTAEKPAGDRLISVS